MNFFWSSKIYRKMYHSESSMLKNAWHPFLFPTEYQCFMDIIPHIFDTPCYLGHD